MPEHYQPHIFDLFHRVPSEETIPSSGVGMGLAIAKQVMEQHGGRIWVESREGNGSTFFVSFPDESDRAYASSVRGRTILLVEDDEALVQAVEALLTADGANVIVVRTGEKALEELRSRAEYGRPDAVLLDIGLPGMSGPDVLAQLRKPGSPWMSLPVVVCSDPRNAAEGERCIMLGIHEFVPKDSHFIEALSASLRTLHWIV
jgi:CheY-like chemotaxis protein